MAKTFTIQITVPNSVEESTFEAYMLKGLKDGDIHHISWIVNNVMNIKVLPLDEPAQEWEVMVQSHKGEVLGTFGYRGTKAQAERAALESFPLGKYTTARVKPD